MPAVVLESNLGSQYEDSPTSYEFPGQYLRYFRVDPHQPLYAVIYEPRGDGGKGQMRYVGWAQIAGDPAPTGRTTRNGRPLYAVSYVTPAEPFETPVPREIMDEPIETWLRAYERGRPRNVATFGRAVRPLTDADFQRILELGGAATLEVAGYPQREEHAGPLIAIRERTEVLVAMLKRSGEFRREIISSYGERCAVSSFGLGQIPLAKSRGLLDAAHIRPVSDGGPDHVTNGLPLTPTLHRLFDSGLFTVEYADGSPVVRVSNRLERTMIVSPDERFRLELQNGMRLNVPENARLWPSRQQLEYHGARIFLAD